MPLLIGFGLYSAGTRRQQAQLRYQNGSQLISHSGNFPESSVKGKTCFYDIENWSSTILNEGHLDENVKIKWNQMLDIIKLLIV